MPLAQQSGFDISGIYAWLSKDMCQIDASLADQQFHTNPPLLQLNEVCEVAFQCRKDLVLLTSKRILFINKEDKIGAKFSFTSFPYSSVKAFKERHISKKPSICFRWLLQVNMIKTWKLDFTLTSGLICLHALVLISIQVLNYRNQILHHL